ncbi:MAG TPA: hypothetical protein VGS80_10390 [Ktedonobacterales bacterium]|nr:hypothetical protein [Ktedonobacterales bacterium]
MDLHPTRRQAVWLHLPLLLAVVVALVTGCATTSARLPPTPIVLPTATPTPHPAPTPVTGLLAPPPTECPTVPEPQRMTLSADFGGGFVGGDVVTGGAPVWQAGLGSPLDLEAISGPTPYPGTKVLWIVGPNYGEPVTLQGHDLRTGTPIWWLLLDRSGTGSAADAAPSVVLDPAIPNRGATDNSAGHWSIYGVGLTFTVAGCYELEVGWPEGHWRTVFAAGR